MIGPVRPLRGTDRGKMKRGYQEAGHKPVDDVIRFDHGLISEGGCWEASEASSSERIVRRCPGVVALGGGLQTIELGQAITDCI